MKKHSNKYLGLVKSIKNIQEEIEDISSGDAPIDDSTQKELDELSQKQHDVLNEVHDLKEDGDDNEEEV